MTTPLDFAVSQVGVKETGDNRGVPHERYALAGEEPLPWCARFVRWCFAQAGTPLPGNRYLIGRVDTLREELAKRGAILPASTAPEAGDLVFLRTRGMSDRGPGRHIGIVETVTPAAIVSIDGNWGDAVSRVTRGRAAPEILCFGRWPMRAMA